MQRRRSKIAVLLCVESRGKNNRIGTVTPLTKFCMQRSFLGELLEHLAENCPDLCWLQQNQRLIQINDLPRTGDETCFLHEAISNLRILHWTVTRMMDLPWSEQSSFASYSVIQTSPKVTSGCILDVYGRHVQWQKIVFLRTSECSEWQDAN